RRGPREPWATVPGRRSGTRPRASAAGESCPRRLRTCSAVRRGAARGGGVRDSDEGAPRREAAWGTANPGPGGRGRAHPNRAGERPLVLPEPSRAAVVGGEGGAAREARRVDVRRGEPAEAAGGTRAEVRRDRPRLREGRA